MDKASALANLERFAETDRRINELLRDLAVVNEREYRVIKIAAGELLGQMYHYLMKPIYEEYPDLKPDELM